VKIAYLVFAYKNPKLLQRVIDKLSTPDNGFFIHIDYKSDIEKFRSIHGPNVFFTKKRIPVYWAEFSGIQAILLLMQEALSSSKHYDYFVLLSGSDYPLKSAEYIRKFLEANRSAEFISLVKVPAPGKPLSRINTLRYPTKQPVLRFILRALARFGLAQRNYRKYLEGMDAYSGNTWWTLSREACQYIVDFEHSNPRVAEFFGKLFAPEESFFHTILGNSEFRARVKRNLLYEDWTKQGAHPEMIGEPHIAEFEAREIVEINDGFGKGELLFARKFSDETVSLLDRIDTMIRRKEDRSLAGRPR
jgi:hypothetical protein